MVSGTKQASKVTHKDMFNTVLLVWGSLRKAHHPINIIQLL